MPHDERCRLILRNPLWLVSQLKMMMKAGFHILCSVGSDGHVELNVNALSMQTDVRPDNTTVVATQNASPRPKRLRQFAHGSNEQCSIELSQGLSHTKALRHWQRKMMRQSPQQFHVSHMDFEHP